MSRNAAVVLRAFAVWTVWVWGTRIWNIVGDTEHSAGFKIVHSVLALISIAFAVATWLIVSRVRKQRLATSSDAADNPTSIRA